MTEFEPLLLRQYHDVPKGGEWGHLKKPVLVIDGHAQEWRPNTAYSGGEAFVVGVDDNNCERICSALSAEIVTFYEMRVADISHLRNISGVRQIIINWNPKLIDLRPLSSLLHLDALSLIDTPKAIDLSPVATLKDLRAFEFSGSPTLSSKNTAESLSALGELQHLEELRLHAVKVITGGLRPIAKCANLKRLWVANTFPTEDYAFLAAKMPNTTCKHFAATVAIDGSGMGEGIDTMVVGRRKPFLSSIRDADRIVKYEILFEDLKAGFVAS